MFLCSWALGVRSLGTWTQGPAALVCSRVSGTSATVTQWLGPESPRPRPSRSLGVRLLRPPTAGLQVAPPAQQPRRTRTSCPMTQDPKTARCQQAKEEEAWPFGVHSQKRCRITSTIVTVWVRQSQEPIQVQGVGTQTSRLSRRSVKSFVVTF